MKHLFTLSMSNLHSESHPYPSGQRIKSGKPLTSQRKLEVLESHKDAFICFK